MTIRQTLVHEVLEELGSSAEEIAANLERCGIKGQRETSDSCPISNYLWQTFSVAGTDDRRLAWIEVGCEVVFFFTGAHEPELCISMPKAIDSFTRQFDEGYFPHLVWQ